METYKKKKKKKIFFFFFSVYPRFPGFAVGV